MGRKRHALAELCGECNGLKELVHEGESLQKIADFLKDVHALEASPPTIKQYVYERYDRERLGMLHDVLETLYAEHGERSDVCCVIRDSLGGLGHKVVLSSVRCYIRERFSPEKCDA